MGIEAERDRTARIALGLLIALNAVWLFIAAVSWGGLSDIREWQRQHDQWYAMRDSVLCEQHNEQRRLMKLTTTIDCHDHPGRGR